MCTVCPAHESSSTAGADLGALGVMVVMAAVAGLTFKILTVIWPLYLAFLVAAWIWVFIPRKTRRKLRKKAWRATVHAIRRRRQAVAVQTVTVPRAYEAALYLTKDGHTEKLTSGPVPGLWDSAATVQAEILRRYTDQHALPAGVKVAVTAAPVKGGGRL